MRGSPLLLILFCFMIFHPLSGQSLPDSLFARIPGGSFTMGESENDYQGPPGSFDAPVHTVTLTSFYMLKTEVTNRQYVNFLNAAYQDGLLEVRIENSPGPDMGFTLVYGTDRAPEEYRGLAIINLSGTRVMKDHDNDDGDDDPFTGVIEPENPLNICYVGYDETRGESERFYVKDPANPNDFDWVELTNYYNYSNVSRQNDTSVLLNDYDQWEELKDYPNHLPTLAEVKNWPATFIRWYGAKAFALFYGADLPTEAQWEYAAKGGNDFVYATADGSIQSDGSSAIWNHLQDNPALGHVQDVKINGANPYGLYNMAGNVWEWIEDWYDANYYADSDGALDPVNKTDSGLKVRRGGSWNYHQSTLKSAARAKDEQFKGNDHFGFRVVLNSTSSVSATDAEKNKIEDFGLFQNYPNPFNAYTVINYQLPKAQRVKLQIYSTNGRLIDTLVNEYQTPGFHQVGYDAAHLTSTLYLYKIEAEEFVSVKKLMLIK